MAAALVWPSLVLGWGDWVLPVRALVRPPALAGSLADHRRMTRGCPCRSCARDDAAAEPSALTLTTASTPTPPPVSGGGHRRSSDIGETGQQQQGDEVASGAPLGEQQPTAHAAKPARASRTEVTQLFIDFGMNASLANLVVQRLLPAPSLLAFPQYCQAVNSSLSVFVDAGLQPVDVAEMLLRCPQLIGPRAAVRAMQTLCLVRTALKLRRYDVRRLARNEPDLLLLAQEQLADTIETLGELGLIGANLKLTFFAYPALLSKSRRTIQRVCAVLTHKLVGFKTRQLGSLVRHAPWVFDADVHGQIQPAIALLLSYRVHRLETVIRAYPEVLISDVETELRPRLEFLSEIGVTDDELPLVVASFPLLLGLDVETRMRPVASYLLQLKIDFRDVAKICRAFPSLLGLDCQQHFDPSVAFLNEIGVVNVARFVQRLPPVLGYDVESNLRPKWEYLTKELQMSVYDVTRFPAYFSYPLDRIIMPRMAYLARERQRTSVWSLSTVLTPSDAEFADRVAKSTVEEYQSFCQSYRKKLERNKAEPLPKRPSSGTSWLTRKEEPAPPPSLEEGLEPLPEEKKDQSKRRGPTTNRSSRTRLPPQGEPEFKPSV